MMDVDVDDDDDDDDCCVGCMFRFSRGKRVLLL